MPPWGGAEKSRPRSQLRLQLLAPALRELRLRWPDRQASRVCTKLISGGDEPAEEALDYVLGHRSPPTREAECQAVAGTMIMRACGRRGWSGVG